MSSISTPAAPPRPRRRLLGAVVTLVSIGVYLAAGRLVGSADDAAFAVLLCGLLSTAAVVGAAGGLTLTVAPSGREGATAAARRRTRSGGVTLVVGFVLSAAYWVVRALGVAHVGDPGDIGGGVVQLVAYAVTATGTALLVAARR